MTMRTLATKIRLSQRAIAWFALASVVILPATGQSSTSQGSTTTQRPPLLERQKEIALALSACPRSVASKAAVYVLDRAGYIKFRDGENGFTAIVQHAVPTSQDPQCMDAEGTRTFLPRYLKVAEWSAQGKSADEIKLLVADASRRSTSRAQCFAVAINHADGFSGTPRNDHTSVARQKASCTTSSASARLWTPKIRVSTETMRPDSRRKR